MLQNIKLFYGTKLAAVDGEIGHTKDFYFDDQSWVIRYLVADTGSWLPGRQVLISPHAFAVLDKYDKTFNLKLRKKQIEGCPPIERHKPVSRQYETEYYRYYGWPAYWNGDALWGPAGYPLVLPPTRAEIEDQVKHHHRDDKHLQSTQAVTGYAIQAMDGTLGTVADFMIDDRSWAIRELVVEAGHWYSGKEILVATSKIDRISYAESKVYVHLTKADLQRTKENDLVRAGA